MKALGSILTRGDRLLIGGLLGCALLGLILIPVLQEPGCHIDNPRLHTKMHPVQQSIWE